MLILLGILTAAAVLAPVLIRTLGRPAFCVLALAPLAGFAWVLQQFLSGPLGRGEEIVSHTGWLSTLNMNIVFRLDGLAGIFSLIILGVGALVLLYCWGYFDSNPRRLAIFGAQMVAFSMAMFGLVTSDSFLLMYIFWEITSVLSFLLVGYYGERASSRRAAGQALMVTTLGGLTMLVGFIVLGQSSGIWYFSDLGTIPDLSAVPHTTIAIILILAGALSKSAIAPTHFWLPGAMAAPTPVSAYLHSAAMVKAGIYLVARLAPDMHVVQTWHLVIIPVGIFTMLMSGWMALRQKDLKLILAYGTVSQLGFLMAVISVGSREAMMAGLALTCAHSLFKATLFMVVGAIDHTTGTRNTQELSGLWRKQPYIFAIAALAAASMAGIPPLFGFVAKEAALEAILHEGLLVGMPGRLMLVGMVLGSILTMTYSCFFLYGAFATKPQSHPTGGGISEPVATMHSIGPKLYLAPTLLMILTIALGVYPPLIGDFIDSYLDAAFPAEPGEKVAHLALWHGLTLPLLLSAVIVASGALLFWQRHLLRYLQSEEPALGSADGAYDAVLMFFRRVSLRLTASTQRGSLMVNLGIIFAVLTLLPLAALIAGDRNDIRMELWGSPWQAVLAVIIVAMAIGATLTHNRLSGVIMVGVTGYSLAMIFALHGAPDLALTQVLVETIVMVVFMLVLRKMPTNTEWRGTPKGNRNRAWLSIAVGLSVTIVALFALNARQAASIAEYIPDLAYEIGHGANAVNVLLVDLRAWDTLGEISVLVIAATGVASLIYGTRSFARASRRPTLSAVGRRWLSAEIDSEKAQNRSLMVDVITRISFPSMIVLSMYFFFAGHNAPGGGFAGGLVAALALSLRYLAGGRAELEEALPIDAGRLLGSGLLLSALAAIWPMFLGRPPLTTEIWDFTLPLVGEMHLPSALLFDAGVYLIVIGLIMHILTSLGGQIDQDEAARRQRARDRARSMAREAQRRRQATAAGKENR
ncbi:MULTISPECIES: Na+/H+ antiporter subunit A [unclassified Corynebacterium]|uniref:Na+/H+ antiporter subunit A n=1 Tax=unclassified Corynebacterium TaxID=2624378 RepID=UPI0029CA7CE7|nr:MULTISPECIES: Na+/H+ antiporter subunit A [unclassified Corynebacterium]WPF65881.1 Na+/H+ antiporter subunit A [Corynebacterium sp. 22KM0430]WPF68374.1 Na+/H+ antiporter subunit A [Corynebacterium sp. 21KM1197]